MERFALVEYSETHKNHNVLYILAVESFKQYLKTVKGPLMMGVLEISVMPHNRCVIKINVSVLSI